MTEALQKRSVVFTTCLILITQLIYCESKKFKNELVHSSNQARFKSRSSFCLQMEPNSGMDDTAPMRFHKETQRCYRVGEKGPCGEMMVFTMEDNNFGVCDCDQSLRCGRPLVFWPDKNRCYYAYDQGPCREGKWLVFGFDLHPVCRRNPCLPKEIKQSSFENRYWFSYKGQCYRTYSQGYCGENEILFNMKSHFRPTCVQTPECTIGPINNVPSLVCLPGQRLDFYGQCDRQYQRLKPVENDNGTDLAIIVTPRPSNLYCLYCNVYRKRT